MTRLNFTVILFCLLMAIVIVQQSSYGTSNVDKRSNRMKSSSIMDKIPWFTDNNQELINQSNCAENWSKFEYSCYFLSDYVLTISQASHACSRFPWDSSRLMYIKHPIQLLYAAHIIIKNSLSNLLFQIDPDLIKDRKIGNISSDDRLKWENLIKNNEQSTSTDKQNIVNNYEYCQEINWNVVDEDFPVLILTVKSQSNNYICSLSNAELPVAYFHLCEYALDRCLDNDKCGKHGRCVNTPTKFICKCFFLSDGEYCNEWSYKDIQIIIGIVVVLISIFVTFEIPRNILRLIRWAKNRLRGSVETPSPSTNEIPNNIPGYTNEPKIDWSIFAGQSIGNREKKEFFYLEKTEKRLRNRFLFALICCFFLIFFKLPAIHSVQLNNTNFSSSTNGNILTIGQFIRNVFFRIDNTIFISVSIILIGFFSYLNRYEKRDDNNDRSILVEPIKLLQITDRWKTTFIIIIQMFEILEVLEKTMTDIDKSAQFGVFAQIFQRIFFVILIAIRHYPTLASLQFQNICVRLLIVIYFIASTIYLTFFENSDMHWLTTFIKILPSTKENLQIDPHIGLFLHSLTRSVLRYILIGYICAELIMRVVFDSIYISRKRKESIFAIPSQKIDQYSYKPNKEKKQFQRSPKKTKTNENSERCWINIQKYIDFIYQWDKNFRYTTIVICTYTVAYIFLFHLTGTVILLYQSETNNYILYTKHLFKSVLNIQLKDGGFEIQVIIAASITMIIYSIQLFLSIKNFRKRMDEWYKKVLDEPDLSKKLTKREVIRKSTQYPSYLLLYLLGGFILCFHLILFLCLITSKTDLTQKSVSQGKIGYIIPILLAYFLQKMIIRWLHFAFDRLDQRKETDLDIKLNILDSILLYLKLISCAFIGVVASIIRLIVSVLVNIIFMPRIDYSYLVEPVQSLDSAHESFEAFLNLEILCIYPLTREFSKAIKLAHPMRTMVNESSPTQQLDGNVEDDNISIPNNQPLEGDQVMVSNMVANEDQSIHASLLLPQNINSQSIVNQ